MLRIKMKLYDKDNNRLIYFKKKFDRQSFWDKHWLNNKKRIKKILLKDNPKSFVIKNVTRFLKPGTGTILEGGCGLGTHVYFLQKLGYEIIGIDNARNTVNLLKKLLPKINVVYGDVRNLNYKEDFFVAYLSLGVIEHFFQGFTDIALEMQRVIKKKGFLFLTFPYMSPFRRFKARVNLYKIFQNVGKKNTLSDDFYQYALDQFSVIKEFEKLGFKLKYSLPYAGIKGLKDELFKFQLFTKAFINLIYKTNKPEIIRKLKRLLDLVLIKFSAHMILLVFQKE